MKRLIEILSLFFFLFLFTIQIRAQDLTVTENNYVSAQNKLKQQFAKLDSLKNILEIRAQKINDEKAKVNPDKNLIVNLMSGSASLSNEIENQQNKIEITQKEIEGYRKSLNELYSEKIDSLQELEKSNSFKGNKNNLKANILSFTEKKLTVAPKITMLSFHPDKIVAIDLSKIKDSTERKMYEDYLQNALSEVNVRLNSLNESIKETDKILTLQKKTNKFIEESEFDYGLTPQSNISQPRGANANSYTGSPTGDISNVKAVYERNVNEYSLLLNQLNFKPISSKINFDASIEGKNTVHNLSDYNDLQKEVRKRLLEYKLILTHKLNADK